MQDRTKLENRLLARLTKAVADFDLIHPGDRVMVAMSGGKDSYGVLHLLSRWRERSPVKFEMIAVNLDQGHPGFPAQMLEDYLASTGVPYRMLKEDTYSIVKEKVPEGETTCWLCSRLRRGILYNAAVKLGCDSIALGHHREDLIESLLMSAFYAGALKSMPPKLASDDGRNTIIRPLALCAEEDLEALASVMRFPIIPCDLCGSQPNLRRKRVKRLLTELEAESPGLKANLLNALGNVVPEHLLVRARTPRPHDIETTPAPDPGDELTCAPAPELIQLGRQ